MSKQRIIGYVAETPPDAASAVGAANTTGARAANPMAPLTVRTLREICTMDHDDSEFMLENRYLTKGLMTALFGMGGLGKSRLAMQFAMCCITGRDFIGWRTRCPGVPWMFIQSENSNRRLKEEAVRMLHAFTPEEAELILDKMTFHTLEGDDDGYLSLDNPENMGRIIGAIAKINPGVVVIDPLSDFAAGDLNSDEHMVATVQMIQRAVKRGAVYRALLILHHTLTGLSGVMGASGFGRTSHGRNSKKLRDKCRAAINLAPQEPEDNEKLVVSSGKCSNGPEFKPFGIVLNLQTMMYEVDADFSFEEWQERMANVAKGKAARRERTADDLLDLITLLEQVDGEALELRSKQAGFLRKEFRGLLPELIERGDLYPRQRKTPGAGRPKTFYSRMQWPDEPDAKQTTTGPTIISRRRKALGNHGGGKNSPKT